MVPGAPRMLVLVGRFVGARGLAGGGGGLGLDDGRVARIEGGRDVALDRWRRTGRRYDVEGAMRRVVRVAPVS